MSTLIEEQTSTTTDTNLEEVFRSIVENEESHLLDDTDSGDHERFSHYVSKEDIVRSSMSGAPVIALCGKKWTPKRNPEKYLVCPDCNERLEKFPQT